VAPVLQQVIPTVVDSITVTASVGKSWLTMPSPAAFICLSSPSVSIGKQIPGQPFGPLHQAAPPQTLLALQMAVTALAFGAAGNPAGPAKGQACGTHGHASSSSHSGHLTQRVIPGRETQICQLRR